MRKIEELQDQIQQLFPEEFKELRDWFWDLDGVAWDAQIEADAKSGKLDGLIETSRRRYRELVDGKVEGVPGPLVFGRLRAKLPLSDEQRAELDRRKVHVRLTVASSSPPLPDLHNAPRVSHSPSTSRSP